MSKGREFSDETLMAFADGELEGAELKAVEDAIGTDHALATRVAMFIETRARVQGAFGSVMNERPPERLFAAAMGTKVISSAMIGRQEAGAASVPFDQAANENRPTRQWRTLAMAASIAAVVAGIGGYLAGVARQDAPGAMVALFSAPDAINRFLTTAAEGTTASLPGGSATIAVAGSYKLSDGRLCRVMEARHLPSSTGAEAIGCREATGWRIEIAMPRKPADGVFRPAGAGAGLDAFLDAAGAGQAMTKDEVTRLIRQGWR